MTPDDLLDPVSAVTRELRRVASTPVLVEPPPPCPGDRLSAARRAIAALAHVRWGRTGFCCPKCGGRDWRPVSGRPRVRRCAACHTQASVTGGTPFMYCKLALELLVPLLDQAIVLVPTVSSVERSLGIARSSAHHVVVRILRVWQRLHAAGAVDGEERARLPFLRPKRAMADTAPAAVRALDASRILTPTARVDGVLGLGGSGVVGTVAVEPPPSDPLPDRDPTDLGLRLARDLVLRRRVSLRWMPAWLTAVAAAWNVERALAPFRGALVEILAAPHRSRRGGDPWLGDVGAAGWSHSFTNCA